jgi:hypothetical protein
VREAPITLPGSRKGKKYGSTHYYTWESGGIGKHTSLHVLGMGKERNRGARITVLEVGKGEK